MTARKATDRPTDWSPLGKDDPCPGDPEKIRESGRELVKAADIESPDLPPVAHGGGRVLENMRSLAQKSLLEGSQMRQEIAYLGEITLDWADTLEKFQDRSLALLTEAKRLLNAAETNNREQNTPAKDSEARLAALHSLYQDLVEEYAASDQATAEKIRKLEASRQPAEALAVRTQEDIMAIFGGESFARLQQLRESMNAAAGAELEQLRHEYLTDLAQLPFDELVAYQAGHVIASRLPLPGENPQAVEVWWDSIDEERKSVLCVAFPGIIGNLEGIPMISRLLANEALIKASLKDSGISEDVKGALRILQEFTGPGVQDREQPRGVYTLDLTDPLAMQAQLAAGYRNSFGTMSWKFHTEHFGKTH